MHLKKLRKKGKLVENHSEEGIVCSVRVAAPSTQLRVNIITSYNILIILSNILSIRFTFQEKLKCRCYFSITST
jgi:hypothetical protein